MRTDVESFDDFIQYYTEHFVKSRVDPDILYMVGGRYEHEVATMAMYTSGRLTRNVIMTWEMIKNTVLFGIPRLGTIVYKNELLYLYYQTTRNGGRGFDPRRIGYLSFNGWYLTKRNYPTFTTDLMYHAPFVHNAVRQGHTPWDEAQTDLLSTTPKFPAYALSYNFGAYLGDSEFPSLTYKSKSIGVILRANTIQLHKWAAEYRTTIHRTLNKEIEFIL
jgi:hypothetical protein